MERMTNMQEVQVSLSTIEEVKKFVQTLTRFEGDFELISERYVVDAKSILGLFSIDLSKPVLLRIDVEENKREEVLEAIKEYRVNN